MPKTFIVYTQETCPPCHEEKLWLTEKGIPYEERNIRQNDRYLNELIDLGASATPVTVIKEGEDETVIFGFDREKFEEFLSEN
ncbi:glutaredoxin family protein [Bacillus sp. BGMRC 2118]|nr:glutaredoxin family protein [Bacillus sp. BGMRC 2118]